jgi:hypothetical protein
MDERLLNRFWEVDFLRGIAVAMMVLYHFVFDLNYFGISDFDIHNGFWFYFAHLTAFLFVLLVGVSLVLSHERMVLLGQEEAFLPKLLKRGVLDTIFGHGHHPCNLRGCRKRFHSLWGAAPHRSLSHLGISFSSSWGRKRLSWFACHFYRNIFSKLKRRLSLAIVAWPLSCWILFSGLSSLIPMVWSCSAGDCAGRHFLPRL